MKGSTSFAKQLLVCAVIMSCMLVWCASASAYSTTGKSWPNDNATLMLDHSSIADVSDTVTLTALYNAATSWNSVPASTFVYTVTTTVETLTYNTADGNSVVYFDNLGYVAGMTGTAAYTQVWDTGNDTTEADVIFNNQLAWTTAGSAVTGTYNVETIALREFGYALGLDNSTVTSPRAVMNLNTATPSYRMVTLTNDDRQGVSSIYPQTFTSTGINIRTAPYIIAADLDTDGRDDIIYISKKGFLYYTTDLSDWVKVGTNKFTKVAAGDFNADGDDDDLVIINTKGLIKYTTDLTNYTTIGTNKFTDVVSGDFSDNGTNKDIAAINAKGLIKFTTDKTNWGTIGTNKFQMLLTADISDNGSKKDIVAINNRGLLKYTTDKVNWGTIGNNKFSTFAMADLSDNGTEKDIVAINNRSLLKYSTDKVNWGTIGTNKFTQLAIGDFSDNGSHKDIVAMNAKGLIKYTTDTANWNTIGTTTFRGGNVITGDFNGDDTTRDDIATVNTKGNVYYTSDYSTWTKIKKPTEN
ncbi:matrixin family metalloprotease [Thermodesulfobacteriota bacterium]